MISLSGLTESITKQHLEMAANPIMFIVAFWMFTLALGFDFMLPNGPMWASILLWLASYLAGNAMNKIDVPPLLGMLVVGILLRNLPGDPMQGLPESWSAQFRAFGLSIILLRSGLELDIPKIKKQGFIAIRLTLCPGVSEAFTISAMSLVLFKMPFALALSGGFVLAAVSPAVVVSGMFDLHKRGYGVIKGIPSLVVAAASFDDVVAISGFAMCIGLAVKGGENPILGGMHGPINLIGGSVCGYMGGHIAGCTTIWNTKLKRSAITILLGLLFMFGATTLHYNGGGAMAGLMTGIFASMCWQNGWCGILSNGPSNSHHHDVERHIATIWANVAQPLLFGVIGASVDFRELELNVLPKAILAVIVGMAVRVPVAFLVTGGKDFNFKERSFIGLSWIPKATVQAALGSVPLDLIREKMDHTDPDFDKWEQWGKDILVTAVVSILLTAPIGLICISTLGPRWLVHTKETNKDSGKSDSQDKNIARNNSMSEPENWTMMEEARRASPEGRALQARTHTSRFFTRMVDEMKAIRSLLYNAKKTSNGHADGNDEQVENALATTDDSDDEEKLVSVNLNGMEKPIKMTTIDQVLKRLDVIDEGIESVWRVINEQGDEFPTSDLFITSGGNYQNIPTYKEITRKLSSILSEEEAARGDENEVVRRTSFNGFVPSRAHIKLYHQPMRSFTGYKPSAQHIEQYKQKQREICDEV